MARIYFDSDVVIGIIEGETAFDAAFAAVLPDWQDTDHERVVSDLVGLECRVKPLATGNRALVALYDGFLNADRMTTVGLPRSVFELATHIRAEHGFRTADALHLAAELEAGCDRFVTADLRLARFPDIEMVVVRQE